MFVVYVMVMDLAVRIVQVHQMVQLPKIIVEYVIQMPLMIVQLIVLVYGVVQM